MNGIPLNIDFQQILLHLFNVVILFAILFFLVYKPVKNFMDKRKQEYLDMDNEAENKVKEANELKEEYEEKLRQSEAEIKAMRSEASRDATEKAHAIEEEARDHAEKILELARMQADNEKDKILGSAGEEVAKLAKDAASKAMFGSPSEAYDSFLKAAEDEK